MGWLIPFLPLIPPAFPFVAWPLAARLVPPVQTLAKGLFEGAWWLGVATGLSWGLTIGVVLGVIATVTVGALLYWSFCKPVRQRRCDDF